MNKKETTTAPINSRKQMIALLNKVLFGAYQAIIDYFVYSQEIKGAAYTDIARELKAQAGEVLRHAIKMAKKIDYLGGVPSVIPKAIKFSTDPVEMP